MLLGFSHTSSTVSGIHILYSLNNIVESFKADWKSRVGVHRPIKKGGGCRNIASAFVFTDLDPISCSPYVILLGNETSHRFGLGTRFDDI